MGLIQQPPGDAAHGEARLTLYLDGSSDQLSLAVASSWWTEDGDLSEASLQIAGDTTEAYDLLNEATTWVWRRWKRPIAQHGPFPGDQ